jgi:hypothetical protein
MKNIFKSSLLLLSSICLFAACADDNDSNPTLVIPTTFQLNTPAYAPESVDLSTTSGLAFTWSQPNYGGFPVAAQYQMQFSLNNSFTTSVAEALADESGATVADYVALDQIYNSCKGTVDAAQLAKGLMQIAKWDSDKVPATTAVYARLAADYANSIVYSNVVTINVSPYYVELKDAAPIMWYLVGKNILDGSWSNNPGVSSLPMFIQSDYAYDKATGEGEITYLNYFTTDGWKIQPKDFNWNLGFMSDGNPNGAVFRNNGDDNGDIWCDPEGYYLVTVNTANNTCTIAPQDITPKVYDQICMSGSFNGWSDTDMTPANKEGENHVWVYTMTVEPGVVEQVKFKIAGSWDTNWGYGTEDGEVNTCGKGTNGGKNIGVPEGTWIILFNDITGEFSITAKE